MFEGIKEIFGRRDKNMTEAISLKNIAGIEPLISSEMATEMRLWKDMYEEREGLHISAALSFEMARMITVELRSKISGSKRAEFLDKNYKQVIDNIRIPVEYGCAKGGMVMKPYVSNGQIVVDFIQADEFYPTAVDDNGNIMGAVFVQTMARGGSFYTRLEGHNLTKDGYEISNRVFKSNISGVLGREVSLAEVPEWSSLSEVITIANVRKPLFGYFKPAVANSVDPKSPLGISIFANSVNLIEDANKQYERFLWEFESGERALVANSMAFKRDRDGKPRLPDKRLYRTLDVEDVDFFREWSPTLRGAEIGSGLDRIFRQIEFNSGFAYGTISTVDSRDRTAEEIRNSKQRSYTTISDNQKALQNALLDLVYAMDVWCTLYKLAPMGEYNVSFEFDDSIAADRKTEFEEKLTLVNQGIMEPWEFRMWYFGENEETAKMSVNGKNTV